MIRLLANTSRCFYAYIHKKVPISRGDEIIRYGFKIKKSAVPVGYRGFFYSNFIALVGSILDISIEGTMSISTERMNIPIFIGISSQVNSMGTQSI